MSRTEEEEEEQEQEKKRRVLCVFLFYVGFRSVWVLILGLGYALMVQSTEISLISQSRRTWKR